MKQLLINQENNMVFRVYTNKVLRGVLRVKGNVHIWHGNGAPYPLISPLRVELVKGYTHMRMDRVS